MPALLLGVINTRGVVSNCALLTGTIGSAVTVNAATVTISGGWSGSQVGTATITGSNIAPATIVYGNIATVNAGAIVSVGGSAISATCIDTLNAGSITVVGGWSSGQIGSVNAGTINAGTLNGAVIGILNAGQYLSRVRDGSMVRLLPSMRGQFQSGTECYRHYRLHDNRRHI